MDVLRSAVIKHGVESVTTAGPMWMLQLLAVTSDIQDSVRGHSIIILLTMKLIWYRSWGCGPYIVNGILLLFRASLTKGGIG